MSGRTTRAHKHTQVYDHSHSHTTMPHSRITRHEAIATATATYADGSRTKEGLRSQVVGVGHPHTISWRCIARLGMPRAQVDHIRLHLGLNFDRRRHLYGRLSRRRRQRRWLGDRCWCWCWCRRWNRCWSWSWSWSRRRCLCERRHSLPTRRLRRCWLWRRHTRPRRCHGHARTHTRALHGAALCDGAGWAALAHLDTVFTSPKQRQVVLRATVRCQQARPTGAVRGCHMLAAGPGTTGLPWVSHWDHRIASISTQQPQLLLPGQRGNIAAAGVAVAS